METFDPHAKSKALRRFKPSRKRAGVFSMVTSIFDASLLIVAFSLVISPLVLQPGIRINLPKSSSFSGGARLDSMILSIPTSGDYYFNDVRLSGVSALARELKNVAAEHPNAPLIIEADERVSYGLVTAAWDVATEAGIAEVTLGTKVAAVEEPMP